ncbi:MAG: rubrerythrin [Gammaproteobacteria bacterium]|nr:rubrerythrin [Gammaproteobacteria bacterium]
MSAILIASVEELFAHALTMLSDAGECYEQLADQMEIANNPEVSKIFRWLAEKQQQRTRYIEALAGDAQLPHISPWDHHWEHGLNPQAPDTDVTHYMMTPYHALAMAAAAERSAAAYFKQLTDADAQADLCRLAAEFSATAADFAVVLEQRLSEQPAPEQDWDKDHDPPVVLE